MLNVFVKQITVFFFFPHDFQNLISNNTTLFPLFLFRTNLPAQIMNFPDYMTMNVQEPSCVSHQEVLNYLKSYSQHFDIRRHFHVTIFQHRIDIQKYSMCIYYFI